MDAPKPVSELFTEEQKIVVREMFTNGCTQQEIADYLNCKRRTAGKLCNHLDLKRGVSEAGTIAHGHSLELIEKIRRYREVDGLTIIQIVPLVGLSLASVGRICRTHNLGRAELDPSVSPGHIIESSNYAEPIIIGVLPTMPDRRPPRQCRECNKLESEDCLFSEYSNICLGCKKLYNQQYKEANYERIRKQHRESYQVNKKKRQDAVRKAQQRSPEAFLIAMAQHLRCYSKQKRLKLNKAVLIVEIDSSYLIDLYYKQEGRCARTKIPMVHKFKDLRTISVDRIDSNKGYVASNIQLVCKFINLGKSNHTNEEVDGLLNAYYEQRIQLEVQDSLAV